MIFQLSGKLTYHSLPPPDLRHCTRQQLREYFENTYDLDETLFSGIIDEKAFYTCPDRLRLPLVFYVAHPAVVYVNKMLLSGLLTERVDPTIEAIAETGVDEMSWDDLENYRMGGSYKWPSMESVYAYRRKVRAIIIDRIENFPLTLPITRESPWYALVMGTEHERIHFETSSVLIRQLPVAMLQPPEGWSIAPLSVGDIGENTLLPITGGEIKFGKPENFPTFGWDNEFGREQMTVPDFQVSKYPVTNGEFLAFVHAGGYENQALWTEEGWRWRAYREAKHPTFWVCDQRCKSGCGATLAGHTHCTVSFEEDTQSAGAAYRYRTIFQNIDLPLDWPVDINYHEAKAFCKWRGPEFRLLTEAEHNYLRDPMPEAHEETYQRDYVFSADFKANLHLTHHTSTPVNMYPANANGIFDLHGNVWQWVEDHFNGLPGFKTMYLYDDFSSPCFDSRHSMILGGSFVSTGGEASLFARFSFRRHFFQHAGFRLVRSSNSTPVRLVDLTLDLQFDCSQIPNLDKMCALKATTNAQYLVEDACSSKSAFLNSYPSKEAGSQTSKAIEAYQDTLSDLISQHTPNTAAALVIGAAVGSVPFRLSKTFDRILAADYCAQFVNTCIALQSGSVPVPQSETIATLPEGSNSSRVVFKQLTWLPVEIGYYPVVMFHEFFDRAINPKAWLVRLREVVTPGGIVVVTSRGAWDVEALKPFIETSYLLETKQTLAAPHFRDGSFHVSNVHVSIWRKV